MSDVIKCINEVPFDEMEAGSFYTIIGTGGSLQEWIDNYNKELESRGIPVPPYWVNFTGAQINAKYDLHEDKFSADLQFLAFPLPSGEDAVGSLAVMRLQMGDKWFDDFVDNYCRCNG